MSSLRYPVMIRRLPALALFEARGTAAVLESAIAAAGLSWPSGFNRVSAADGVEVVRFGPKRVLVIATGEREGALAARLEAAFREVETADIALVSDMYVAFEVAGAGAEDVVRQGAPLDLSAGAFPPGAIAGTELWAITAIIARIASGEPGFRLLVDISYAGYIADWLATAAGSPSTERPGTMQRPPASLRP